MKVTPLTGSMPTSGAVEGQTHAPDRIARAKAIAAGDHKINVMPSELSPPEAPRPDIRRIKMNTNATVNRTDFGSPEAEVVLEANPVADTSAVPPVVEDTKPLDPQFAVLAKQRRALQAKEREIADREKALQPQPVKTGTEELVARLKSQPLSVLQEYGVTYDQLTEAILSNQTGLSPEIQNLKAEIKALKEDVDKTLSDKDAQAEKQVLAEIQRDINSRAHVDPNYEMIRATGSQPEVKELIHRVWKETGEVLDVSEAMQLVEDDLINESLKLINTAKMKSRIAPPPQQQPPQRQIKTLTNRDTASPVMSRRERALAAALGTLKRQTIMAISPQYANSTNQLAALKELYTDDKDYMKNIVYAKNPWLAMIPKNESPDGFAGKQLACVKSINIGEG